MARFAYRAVDQQGRRIDGVMEAAHTQEVVSSLAAKGLKPVRVQAASRLEFLFRPRGPRIKADHVLELTKELADLLEAGVPLERALVVAADTAPVPALREVVEAIREEIQAGSTLSGALAGHPNLFSPLYVSMVKVGEMGGVLPQVMRRIEGFLRQSQEIRKFIVTSSIYPSILMVVGILSVAILITFVVPKFGQIFQDLNQPMPLATRIIFQLSTIIQRWWWAMAGGAVLFALAVRQLLRTDEGRAWWDRTLLRLPFVGPMVRDVEVSRFARTLGTLLESGVPILKGISLAEEVVGNGPLREAIRRIYSGVRQGREMSVLMKRSPLFPSVMVHLVAIGEETGALGAMLLKVADDLDHSIQHRIKVALALVEPMTILIMGVIIGGIILSMLLAIFGINDIAM